MLKKYNSLSTKRENGAVPGYSSNIKLLQFLFNEYGSFEFILDLADSLLNFLKRFYSKNKRYHRVLTLLKYGIPAVVILSDLITKIKAYRKIKEGKNNVNSENDEKIRELFGIKNTRISFDGLQFHIGTEVTQWLIERPRVKLFNILGYYYFENLETVKDVYKEDDTTIITVLELGNNKFAWLLRMFRAADGDIYVRFSDIHTTAENINKVNTLKSAIYKEFISHFDVENNVLMISSSGLTTCPRQDIVERPKQFNIKKFSEGVRKTLLRKKKRGFVFVGVPGTGKSTIIHCLESEIREYPIVYVSSNCFSSPSMVKDTFSTLRYLQPCIAVIEDLDSCELKDKRQALGEFLEQIDDVDNTLNIVILASVNDTSLVHYSLINRPGRFDEVIMVKTPQDIDEVCGIMKCRYDKNKKVDPEITKEFMSIKDIDKDLLEEVIKKKFTQADVCEIVEKSLLLENVVTNETIRESIQSLEESKRALRECNFNGGDPFNKYSEEDAPDDCRPCEEGSQFLYQTEKRE